MALSIQLLKGAARLAYSRCSWSMVSSCFSVFWGVSGRGRGTEEGGQWASRGSAQWAGVWEALRAPTHATATAHLQGFPAAVGQRAKGIPLVTDLLAARVDVVGVIVIQLAVDQAEVVRPGVGGQGVPDPPAHTCPRPWCGGAPTFKNISH